MKWPRLFAQMNDRIYTEKTADTEGEGGGRFRARLATAFSALETRVIESTSEMR